MISEHAGVGLDCAAIIGTKDRPEELEVCLASLARTDPPLREVIVADQGAGETPAPPEGLAVRFLRLDRTGLSRARNEGLARATAEWAFFPDDDCTVAPDVLARAAAALSRLPAAGFLCGRVVAPGAVAPESQAEEMRVLATPQEVLQVGMSAGLFMRRALIERLRGFDDRFGVGSRYPSGEESDLLFRAIEAGERGLYVPAIRIFHPDPFAARDAEAGARRAFEYGRGWGALFAKHAVLPSGTTYQRLQRHYLIRALGGAAVSALTLRPALVRRYLASFRGRRLGWKEYWLEERVN